MKHFIKNQWHNHRQRLALIIVGFFLLAGVVQYALGLTYVLAVTPIILAVIAALQLLFWDVHVKAKLIAMFSIIVAGFIIEQIGVHTAYLFGDYTYGSVMGYQLWGVPITIGITWFIVTLAAWHIVSFGNLNLPQRLLLGAVLAVMFDLILEQFAISYGLWSWSGGRVPLSNYITWFFASLPMLYLYERIAPKAKPDIFIAGILPLMALFFWLMLIVR